MSRIIRNIYVENSTFANTFANVVANKLSEAISVQMSDIVSSTNNNQQQVKQDVILKVGERELARTTINAINGYQKQVGRTLLKV